MDRSGLWGDAVRYWLFKKNWSRAELSRKTGITEKRLGHLVRGGHVSTRLLERIAEAFGVELIDVLVAPERLRDERIQAALGGAEALRRVVDEPREARAEPSARDPFRRESSEGTKRKSPGAKARR